jgi:eukaryotic-like serine/threonine-protein kinase
MTPVMVGRYELIRPLGAGGMGEVFLARDRTLDRSVAIKRVNAANVATAKSILHEARIVAALDHPHIAAVFDVVEHDGQPHVVMEYMEGSTLSAQLTSGPFNEGDVIAYGRQIADALAYAHARNVLHCDIKPSNVMLTTAGVPKVLDFGIARRDAAGDGGDTTAHIRGTPAYMAPEVLAGHAPSYQSDVFSLGVLMYELASGRRPYHRGIFTPPPALDTIRGGISRELSALIARAIAVEPDRRLRSAEELKHELAQLASLPTITSAIVRERARVPIGKTAALLAGLGVVCALLVAGIPRLTSLTPARQSALGVLIFNTTGAVENDYLASGLADVLLSNLASAPGITVVPRSAMTSLTSESQLPEAVKALGLTHVLTGGVQRSGSNLRISLRLLADQGATVQWSRTFDGPIADVFHLERRIGVAALQALRRDGLISNDEAIATVPPTSNADAFDDYAHGRALIERGDVPGNVERALTFFQRAAEGDPSFARAHAAIGDAFWRKYVATRDAAWIDKARGAMLDAMRLAPDDPNVGYTMALIDHGTGHAESAITTLETVVERQPAFDSAYRLLARLHSERGDFDRAIAELREAEALRPAYPATIRELGLAYYDKGRFDEAIASFTKLTSLQPDSSAAYQLLGTAYHAANQLDRALVAYNQSIAITPRATTYSNIGTIHYASRRYADAIAAYRQAITLQPKEAVTHRNLADSLRLNGDDDEAQREYGAAIALAEESLAVNATATRMRSLVAYCHARLGRLDRARTLIAAVVKAAPEDSDAAYKQAIIEALAGRNADAVKYLQRALSLGYSRSVMESDRDLDQIRSLPAYASLNLP